MTNSWKIGGVQLELREDGTFFIYQPDSSRVLSFGHAIEVARCILDGTGGVPHGPIDVDAILAEVQSTVPSGVLNTSTGAVSQYEQDFAEDMQDPEFKAAYLEEFKNIRAGGLTDSELEADKQAAEARASIERGVADVEAGRVSTPSPKPPVKRRPARPRKQS